LILYLFATYTISRLPLVLYFFKLHPHCLGPVGLLERQKKVDLPREKG